MTIADGNIDALPILAKAFDQAATKCPTMEAAAAHIWTQLAIAGFVIVKIDN
jgi:hypothetical protein